MSPERKVHKPELPRISEVEEVCHETSSPNSTLCARCLDLRLEEALGNVKTPGHFTRRGPALDIKIANVGHYYRQTQHHDCKLCHLLWVSRVSVDWPRDKPQDCEYGDELHVFELCEDLSSLRPSFRRGGVLRGLSALYLAVVPSGFTRNNEVLELHGERNGFLAIRRRGTPQPRLFSPQIISPRFDLSLARYWFHYCKDNHRRLCCRKSEAPKNLHLIDCHSLEVITAPDQAEYTALSYVWGSPTTDNRPSASIVVSESDRVPLPPPVPAVITDAIKVTLGLGIHYLWVDRYCIDQDSHSKHQQINQMDLIYTYAELTIIAAAGDDPEYGLPGVRSKARCGQHTVTVGDFDIIPTLRHPHITIQASRWSTRGWTFQESALSRRNIAFTDDQVYFECNAMNCHESLSSELDTLHVEDKSQFMEVLQAGLFGRTKKLKYGYFDESNIQPEYMQEAYNFLRFMGMVEHYTARDLTYDEDSLNAFSGIIRKLEAEQEDLRQLWGVPLNSFNRVCVDISFIGGLAWSHTGKAAACDADGHPRRRPGYPSWSWAGWAGEIEYAFRSVDGRPKTFSSEAEVSVDWGDGVEANLSDYFNAPKNLRQETPTAIYIKALALHPSALSYATSEKHPTLKVFQHPATLALSAGPWDAPQLFRSLQNEDIRRCIFLGHIEKIVVIVILQVEDCSWSRVGLMYLDVDEIGDFCKSWKEVRRKSPASAFEMRKAIREASESFRVI